MPKDSQNICDELKSTVVCRDSGFEILLPRMAYISVPQLGTLKVDAFLKCERRISISHFEHNAADFEYSLRSQQTLAAAVNMDVLRSIKTRITELKGGNSGYNIIYFNQIRPAIANSTYLSFSLYHRFGF